MSTLSSSASESLLLQDYLGSARHAEKLIDCALGDYVYDY